MIKDPIGDRMKEYEAQTTSQRLIKRIPIVCRLDGRSFSTFTKGLKKPFDERLSMLMIETTKYLVKETNANCGYTQSDEITLVWYSEEYDYQIMFDANIFKLTSILASMATCFFNKRLDGFLPEKSHLMPLFDCRIFNVPNIAEAANCFLWREYDCTKNSITLAASEYYSHNQLDNKNSSDKQEMLFQKGVNWNDYPEFFKRGTYIQKKTVPSMMYIDDVESLPEKHHAHTNPNIVSDINIFITLDIPPLNKISNRENVLLFGETPILKEI